MRKIEDLAIGEKFNSEASLLKEVGLYSTSKAIRDKNKEYIYVNRTGEYNKKQIVKLSLSGEYIKEYSSISEAIKDISSSFSFLFKIDNVALIVAPISAVELAIPLPIGMLLFKSNDIFLLSSMGILNFSNTFSMAFLDFLDPRLISSFFSSRLAMENISIA